MPKRSARKSTPRTPLTPRRKTQEERLLEDLDKYAVEKRNERLLAQLEYDKKPYLSKIYDVIKTYLPELSIAAGISFALYLLYNYSLNELFTISQGVLTFSENIIVLYTAYLAYSKNWFGPPRNWYGRMNRKKKSVKKHI